MKSIFLKIEKSYIFIGKFLTFGYNFITHNNFCVAIFPLLIYYTINLLDKEPVSNNHLSDYSVFILLTVFKCFYFIVYSLERISETDSNNKSFNWFILKFTSLYFLVIISFATDFWILYHLDGNNYKNVPIGNYLEQSFDFFYYSFMTITTAGFCEIQAASRIAKVYSIFEVFMGLVFIVYVLSCFNFFRDGLKKDKA